MKEVVRLSDPRETSGELRPRIIVDPEGELANPQVEALVQNGHEYRRMSPTTPPSDSLLK